MLGSFTCIPHDFHSKNSLTSTETNLQRLKILHMYAHLSTYAYRYIYVFMYVS